MVAAIVEKTSNNIEEELNWNILANKLNPDNSQISEPISCSTKKSLIDVGAIIMMFDQLQEFVFSIEKFRKPRWNKNAENNSTIYYMNKVLETKTIFICPSPFY